MTDVRPAVKKSLQARLTLLYAAGIIVAGIVVIGIVDITVAGIKSTQPAGRRGSGQIAGTGNGVGPHQLLVGSAIALAVLIPIAIGLGWFIAGRFLQPLRDITATARVISAGSLQQRLDLGEPGDELADLGRTLDDLFARLQASFDAQRHFVANASHELRTPLAGLRTLLEVALANPAADADSLRSACKEALVLGEHQERLVQALLTLATSERGITGRDSLDLAHIARDVVDSRRDQAAIRRIRLTDRFAAAATVGDPNLVHTLLTNLLDNAIRHNNRDGFVEITTQSQGRQAILAVVNSGPVIPDDQLTRLRQPFQRLSTDRNGRHGYGLGLAIVDAVARAHDARLTIQPRPEGGLSVTVAFSICDYQS